MFHVFLTANKYHKEYMILTGISILSIFFSMDTHTVVYFNKILKS